MPTPPPPPPPPPAFATNQENVIVPLLLQLLEGNKKIHENHERIHEDIASLREEQGKIKNSLQNSLQSLVDEAAVKLKNSLSDDLHAMKSSLNQDIWQAAIAQLGDMQGQLRESISTAVSERMDELEANLGDVMSDKIAEEFGNSQVNVATKINNETVNVRSDVGSLRRIIDASRASQDRSNRNGQFTYFPRLPPELRLRIWKLGCFNDPAVLKLHITTPSLQRSGHTTYYSGYNVPAVIQANRESRCEALKWYKKRFHTFKSVAHGNPVVPLYPTYINFDIDILYMVIDESWKWAFTACWAEIATKLKPHREFRRIAVAYSECYSGWEELAKFLSKPRSKIQEIIVVANGGDLLEIDQRLVPIDGAYPLTLVNHDQDGVDVHSTVAEELEWYEGFCAEFEPDEDDGDLEEDPLSKEEIEEAKEAEASKDKRKAQTWPVITYAVLKDAYPPPNTRILSF